MSGTIQKFWLEKPGASIRVAHGAKVLSVQMQNGEPYMWVKLNTTPSRMSARHPWESLYEYINIEVYRTGQPIERPEDLEFIDTFHVEPNQSFHAFRRM